MWRQWYNLNALIQCPYVCCLVRASPAQPLDNPSTSRAGAAGREMTVQAAAGVPEPAQQVGCTFAETLDRTIYHYFADVWDVRPALAVL